MIAYSITYSIRNKDITKEISIDAKNITSAKKKIGKKTRIQRRTHDTNNKIVNHWLLLNGGNHMIFEILNIYTVDIKVKLKGKKRYSKRTTQNFLNELCCFLSAAASYYKSDDNTYDARIASVMAHTIYTELKDAGYYKEGREVKT